MAIGKRADLVVRGGAIWGHDNAVDALAVSAGRIVAVGADADTLIGPATQVVEMRGGALLPGFGDGHAHPLFAGLASLGAPIAGLHSVAEVLEAVRAWAQAHPDAPWVRGEGYDPSLVEGGLFDARWLDAVVPDRPVYLKASDFHTAWVNTRALDVAGIDATTPQPADGEIPYGPDGSPLGTLREWGAWGLVETVAPPVPRDDQVAALLDAARRCAAVGLTFVQDAWVEASAVQVWLDAVATGGLAIRADLAQLARPDTWTDDLKTLVGLRDEVAAGGRGQVTARTLKFFADGVVENGTAALLEPYHDCPHSHGMPNWEPAALAAAVAAVDALGFEVHIHAIGDAAVRTALDAIEAMQSRNAARDRRPVIAHAQVVDPADLARFAALGVIANFEPLWARPDDLMERLTVPRLGERHAALQYPIASIMASGAAVSFGSDWPVSSHDPRLGIATAVTRQLPDGTPTAGWLPAERITVEQAVEAYTAGVAFQAQSDAGRLRVGAAADLVLLAADPRTVPALELPSIPIVGTWLAGVRTFGA